MLRYSCLVLAFVVACFGEAPLASAQGLIWNAPDEGTEVQFEGDYLQEDERPQDVEKRIKVEWRKRLWIKALKKTNAEYQGQTVPCQWFELKVVTASEVGGDGALVPGPGGQYIYKVLVPLERAMLGPPAVAHRCRIPPSARTSFGARARRSRRVRQDSASIPGFNARAPTSCRWRSSASSEMAGSGRAGAAPPMSSLSAITWRR